MPHEWLGRIMDDDINLSALVVLRPEREGRGGAIDSQNLGEHLPSRKAIEESTQYFRSQGFGISDVVGISFSIEGRRSLFEQLFDQKLNLRGDRDRITSARAGSELEFDLRALPDTVTRHLLAVTFTSPPDFGPGNP